ncbi:sensor histidine kinase [Pseudonocardia sp. NPDC049635]|uniref:sensor histidine kinase n=1 Tax=Pseudonocardia sp. NPDC049635 TaxID=3155506 RepID=UPI003401654A
MAPSGPLLERPRAPARPRPAPVAGGSAVGRLPFAMIAAACLVGWVTVGILLDADDVAWSMLPAGVAAVGRVLLRRAELHRAPGSPTVVVLLLLHQVAVIAATLLNPFFCIYAFIGYIDAMTHLRGRPQITWVLLTALTCALGQSGSIPGIQGAPVVFVLIAAVNVVVATVMIRADRARERVVAERERAVEELARVTRDNAALHDRLVAQARETGVAEERARLSREIHDTVAQGLVAVIRQLEALPPGLDPPVRDRIERAEEAARDCLLEARSAVAALSPHQLADRSLVAALEDLVRRWAREHRVVTQLDADDAPTAIAHERVLLRVAQEGLANVAAHACASTVQVRLAGSDVGTVLEVRDDGAGFDPDTVPRGRGLDGMAERVRAAGGELELRSTAGLGTLVRARLPGGPAADRAGSAAGRAGGATTTTDRAAAPAERAGGPV